MALAALIVACIAVALIVIAIVGAFAVAKRVKRMIANPFASMPSFGASLLDPADAIPTPRDTAKPPAPQSL